MTEPSQSPSPSEFERIVISCIAWGFGVVALQAACMMVFGIPPSVGGGKHPPSAALSVLPLLPVAVVAALIAASCSQLRSSIVRCLVATALIGLAAVEAPLASSSPAEFYATLSAGFAGLGVLVGALANGWSRLVQGAIVVFIGLMLYELPVIDGLDVPKLITFGSRKSDYYLPMVLIFLVGLPPRGSTSTARR